jgi:hypothetical protein
MIIFADADTRDSDSDTAALTCFRGEVRAHPSFCGATTAEVRSEGSFQRWAVKGDREELLAMAAAFQKAADFLK